MPKDGYTGAENLDQRGRCCGRKPLHYKGGSWNSPARPMKFCDRCDREFDPVTGEQRENWAWRFEGAAWVRKTPNTGVCRNDGSSAARPT